MDVSSLMPFLFPAAILSFAVLARVASDLATQSQARQAGRVAQIEGAVSRVAGGIVHDLLVAQASGTTGDALMAVKSAAAAEGAAYVADAMPNAVGKAGATLGTLATMINGEASKQAIAAGLGPVLTGLTAAILPPADAAAVDPVAAPAAT